MGDRGRRAAVAVVLGALAVLVVAALGASSSWGQVFRELPSKPQRVSVTPQPEAPSASPLPSPGPLDELPDVEPFQIPGWLIDLVVALAVVAAIALLAWFVVVVYRAFREPGLRQAAAGAGTGVEVSVIEEQVSQSLEETLARLRSGVAVDDAVVACWRRLESIAADSGIVREATHTSEEFTLEILDRAAVDGADLADLAALYRQAMFSVHVLTDADRERAIRCLENLTAQLERRHVG